MTTEQAKTNIGQPFKWQLCVQWDVIREVTADGYIIGDFLSAPVEDCRLKQPQPEHLKKKQHDDTRTVQTNP